MLQLDQVVVEQPMEELVTRRCKAALVEVGKRDVVAVRRRRNPRAEGHDPLHCVGKRTQKPLCYKPIQARMGRVGGQPQHHGQKKVGGGASAHGRLGGGGTGYDGGSGEAGKVSASVALPIASASRGGAMVSV